MPRSSSRPANPITDAVADPASVWALALAPTFVPDTLHPLERTPAMHAAEENKKPGRRKPMSAARAAVLLARAEADGKLTRRFVRLVAGQKKVYAYRPKGT